MGDKSGIEWCDASWNPITGCSHVSDGCRFCYAETLTRRMAAPRGPWDVPDLPWTAGNAEENVILHPERLDAPRRWARPRVIFVNSMSDLFHELVPEQFIGHVFGVMAATPRHTFQVLTKRPERMADMLAGTSWSWSQAFGDGYADGLAGAMPQRWPLENVWLGTSIESRRHVDRADHLRATPAAHRFISAEPLLGSLAGGNGDDIDLTGIDWLIAGGESGEHFADRPERFLVDAPYRGKPHPHAIRWVRDLRDECAHLGVGFMLKQWGGRTPKAGGRELDGRTHDWTPSAAAVAA